MDTLNRILGHKIIVIIRGIDPADFLNIAGALLEWWSQCNGNYPEFPGRVVSY